MMDCNFSEHVGTGLKLRRSRSLPHNAIELNSYQECWTGQRPKRRVAAIVEQESGLETTLIGRSIYGDEFHHCAVERPATAHFPLSHAVVDPASYQKWPENFSEEMKREYQLYKDVAERREMIVDGYGKTLQGFKGLDLMTELEHEKMRELCEGTIDLQGKVVRPSAMAYQHYL
jgi:hypothetical protein